ncbi:MAG: hypothetical protein AAF655_23305 [Bacteroidota bacterium]
MQYHIVKYTGPFGFIKPWTAVRDGETFSQQFLTPSIVEGMEKKLFPKLLKGNGIHKIVGHRLAYDQMSEQQEQVQPRGWNTEGKNLARKMAVLKRSVLINPRLFLAFKTEEDGQVAYSQHICLCRNEDILLPQQILETSQTSFNSDAETFAGYELVMEKREDSFLVGYNRFQRNEPMYGWVRVVGNPVKTFL